MQRKRATLYIWALRDSNPRPPRCKRGALAPELSALLCGLSHGESPGATLVCRRPLPGRPPSDRLALQELPRKDAVCGAVAAGCGSPFLFPAACSPSQAWHNRGQISVPSIAEEGVTVSASRGKQYLVTSGRYLGKEVGYGIHLYYLFCLPAGGEDRYQQSGAKGKMPQVRRYSDSSAAFLPGGCGNCDASFFLSTPAG